MHAGATISPETPEVDEIASIAGTLNMLTARLVHATAAAIAAGDTNQAGMTTPAAWLAWRTGLSPQHARQIVTLATVRNRYPVLFDAFERGEVSADQMTELVKAPEWAQQHVLAFAEIGTVQRLRRAIRHNAFEPDCNQPATTSTTVRPPHERVSFRVNNGRWRINATLDIDRGKQIEAALTEARDRLYSDGDHDTTWADALTDIAQRSLDTITSRARRQRYRTWFHHDTSTATTTTTDGWRIPQHLAQLLLCDATIAVVHERDSLPISVGRTQHIVPDRTRRIIERRDRGCRVPGCNADRFVEIHHVIHWQHGGPTDTWNLISLCPAHHRMHHNGQLGITGNADQPDGITFADARGSPIPASRPPTPPDQPPPPCDRPYQPPPAGRINWDWVGLGWTHPNTLAARRQHRP